MRVSLNHILPKQNREYKTKEEEGEDQTQLVKEERKPLQAHLLQAAQESRKEQPKIRRS